MSASDQTETASASEPSKDAPDADAAAPEASERKLVEDQAPLVEAWSDERIQAAVEALLFASPESLPFRAIRDVVPEDAATTSALRDALERIRERFDRPESGVRLVQIAGGFQFQTHESVFVCVQSLAKTRVEDRVSPAALETLAIVAYKQPITRAEIDAIRGVGSGSLLRTLMDKKMVKVVGRVDLPGRPFQYGTTPYFLEHFGLGNLKDLPQGREL
jgi:segregation and condensation protein B